ncbi:lipid phosphate phosphatase 1 [Multifurca ochricompacta]|uniref:Lipid phosphate phosphatase 1 n=1 Tax=Multifurca ochricompacta TaxID=376703 RepID=A0AAD4M8N7_9AGAM|nr:lipid phosphate phosphatase 1 [Multifurca ochricompacta]
MPGFLSKFKKKIKEIYGEDSLSWFDSSYALDWIVVLGLYLLTAFIETQPIFERDFSPNDSLIQHPHTSEQISSYANAMIAIALPAALVGLIGGYRSSILEIHHGLLAAHTSCALTQLVTSFLKNRVGRLRPDFLARCQWDASQHVCTGKIHDILNGRKSFPSGHSSTAFVGMTFTALFLAGKTAALCFSVSPFSGSLLGSRFVRLCIVLAPLALSTWVAITRVEDYRHHKEDVIVGGLIGILSGTICYLLYWPSPFSASSFLPETMGRPRLTLDNDTSNRPRTDNYNLAPDDANLDFV